MFQHCSASIFKVNVLSDCHISDYFNCRFNKILPIFTGCKTMMV